MHNQSDTARPLRIAVVNWSIARLGGMETYVEEVLAGLDAAGHSVAFLYERDSDNPQPQIRLPPNCPTWSVERLGAMAALAAARDWRPDFYYVQAMLDLNLEAKIQQAGPSVLFAHTYYGTCVSGTKTWTWPTVVPCGRQFGLGCLVHYFPHRCGGRNPLTMWKQFTHERQRHALLPRYAAILVASRHMQQELIRNGLSEDRVFLLPYPVRTDIGPLPDEAMQLLDERLARFADSREPARLLFVGRLEWTKGCRYALDALPLISGGLHRPVEFTIAGDGSQRPELERRSQMLAEQASLIRVNFAGWRSSDRLQELFRDADLLLVPSLWPEPFGMVGLEAGLFGVPAAAFAVGGIPDWLTDGETGSLAPGNPPTVEGLAAAVQRCLGETETLRRMAQEVRRRSTMRLGLSEHVTRLTRLFTKLPGLHE